MKIGNINKNLCKKEIVGVAYSGGGNRGVVHIGVLRAFLEKKIIPTHVAGVSAGAFVAAFHAYDPKTFNSFTDLKILFSYINKAFLGLSLPQLAVKFMVNGLGAESLGDSHQIKQFLTKRLAFKRFEDLTLPLKIGATNVETGQDKWFMKGDLIPVLMASSATPGIFPPVKIGGEIYIDGGVTDNLPLFELAKEGCGVVYAINAGYSGETKRPPKNFLENILTARDIAQYQTTRYEIELIKALYPSVEVRVIEPKVGRSLAPYDFTWEKAEKAIDQGYEYAMTIL